MKKVFLFFITLSIVFFSACSSKKVYEPEIISGDWNQTGETNSKIIDISSDIALLKNSKVMTKDSLLDVEIEPSHRLISSSDGWIISATIEGDVKLQYIEDKSMIELFELKKTIAGASIKDDVLAVLFADNEMALYSISTKELILKEQGHKTVVLDSRIVNPHFMNDLVLFSTLDGKVIIINSKLKKRLRTVIVSSENHFNNIIYFNVIDGKIVAATGNKILSLAEREVRVKYEIRNITYDGTDIFITTKQGEVVSLTPSLDLNNKVKFPFAHFLGLIVHDDKLYLLEKEGYIIEMSKDLLEYKVYEVDIKKGYMFVADKIFYISDEYISVEN